ncbi:hypothetical protein QC762_606745 [Podospora pseudocomata]|uniref:Uncharacterized protein n=2 Tax=Podospora TaxID=5144 RepID=A0ABR0G858_9PEZI|nr:hypothetical protein QC762_606745 [Podospora pseudocomata]
MKGIRLLLDTCVVCSFLFKNVPKYQSSSHHNTEASSIRPLVFSTRRLYTSRMAALVKNAAGMVARNPGTAAVAGVVTVGAVALAAPLAIAAPVLAAVGFTAEGVAATSIAAGIQAGIGNVVGGSVFAICQSAAAGGAGAAAVATGTQVVGGVAAAGAALGKFLWGRGRERE